MGVLKGKHLHGGSELGTCRRVLTRELVTMCVPQLGLTDPLRGEGCSAGAPCCHSLSRLEQVCMELSWSVVASKV